MFDIYLFDWGDTLMVDFPGATGKMCNWEIVAAVSGAHETLVSLSQHALIYIATGAADSTETEIREAFERVGLSQFIEGYFCKANLGQIKGTPEFLGAILAKLNKPLEKIAMVGDSFEKDIQPALAAGITPIWFTAEIDLPVPEKVRVIHSLSELCSISVI